MVLGFGEGKIDVKLSKLQFAPAETIAGTVVLQLEKPKKARGVRVEFFGEQTSGYGKNRRTYRVFEFKLDLDGEKEYSGYKEYPFEIKIPMDVVSSKQQPPNDLTGSIVGALQFFGGVSPIKWFVSASLDIPMGVDVSKRVQISVG